MCLKDNILYICSSKNTIGGVLKMKCPYCKNSDTRVINSREAEDVVRRRRECISCFNRFTTHEKFELGNFYVIKRDGRKELFSRDKLRMGLLKAFEKRHITERAVDKIINSVEKEIKKYNEVTTRIIGNKVMNKLKKIDKVAYLRFASVYMCFDNINQFKEEIKKFEI